MNPTDQPHRPWLVAVWPGMGHVALTAGYYLMAKMGMQQFAEFSPRDLFDIDAAIIRDGVVVKPVWPQSRLFVWEGGEQHRDVIIFIGEAQPPDGKYEFCEQLIDFARDHDVERVFTFAAMATDAPPGQDARVFAAATNHALLDELDATGIERLQEGSISGLNGVLLAAAAEKGMPGVCLLGEMPLVFAQMLYPKPSMAVLKVFAQSAGVTLDLAELAGQAEAIEHRLNEFMQQVRQKLEASQSAQSPEDEALSGDEWKAEGGLSADDEQHIETLFQIASEDRTRAYELKSELDRLGVFDEYEDRFLDLFSKDNEKET
jgi:proteasome assembly chaperone (PAC2) family protein